MEEVCADLIQFLLLSDLPRGLIFHDANKWRIKNCYPKETCAVLGHHEETLRNLFKIYSGDIKQAADQGSSKLMGVDEWAQLVSDVGIVKEIGVRRTYLIFVNSRMTVVDGSTKRGVENNTQLTFEGFVEGIVRLASLKALPIDREMKAKGFQYPGEYLGSLMNEGSNVYNKWLTKTQRAMCKGRMDPIWRRVDMFILLLVSIVQFGVEKMPGGPSLLLRGSPDERLSYDEVKKFFKKPTPYVFETGQTAKAQVEGKGDISRLETAPESKR